MTHTIKQTFGALLIALALFIGFAGIAFADEESDAEDAIQDAKDIRTDLNKLIYDADAYAGIDIDEAEYAYNEGGELILDAEAELNVNRFEDAIDLAREAEDLLDEAYDDLEDQIAGDADEALDMAREYLEAGEELLEDADEEDLDYNDAEELYEDAEEALDLAEAAFDDKDFQEAEEYADDAIEDVEDMFQELNVELEYYLLDDDEVEEALEEAELMLDYAEMALDEANPDTFAYEVSSGLYADAYDELEEAEDAFDDDDYPIAYTTAVSVTEAAEEILERLKRTVSEFEGRQMEDEDEDEEDESEEDDEEMSEEEADEREKMEQVILLLTQLIALLTQQLGQ